MTNARILKLISFVATAAVCVGPLPAQLMTGPTGGGQSHENHQPGLGINYIISTVGIFPSRNTGGLNVEPLDLDPFVGEITMFAGNFPPRGWQFTDGQVLSIAQNTALFSLLGTTYGGDGRTTFALPDLRGRSPIHFGAGPNLTPRTWGEQVGVDQVTLTVDSMPAHSHDLNPALGDTTMTMPTGGGQPHTNMKPSLGVNFYMPLTGIFPSRNDILEPEPLAAGEEFIGSVRMSGFGFPPRNAAHPDGQLLSIANNTALFSILGTTYGGDGRTNFALPDLRGRVVVGSGQGTGLTNRLLGEEGGVEQVTLSLDEMPAHNHPSPNPVDDSGGNNAHTNMQPYNTLNYIIAVEGIFPSRNAELGEIGANSLDPLLGEIQMFAGNFAPRGWALARGQLLDINQNQALFSILGTTYGGDGRTTFALPDLRGRVPVHIGGTGGDPRNWRLGQEQGVETVALTIDQLPSHTHEYVPEPSMTVLTLTGLFGVAHRLRRRRR